MDKSRHRRATLRRAKRRSDIHFDIDASVVFQLGERLISDIVQALVELVKNCYDADARSAVVTVQSEDIAGETSMSYPDAVGYIVVEDRGVGMDLDTIKRGWLTISSSPKRAMKQRGQTTGLGRTPLGDKGLGRLGAQRLGSNVEILTRPADSPVEHYVAFSWADFRQAEQLSRVPVRYRAIDPPQRDKGTKIVISGLKERGAWTGDAVLQLQTDLSAMLSPYEEIRDFRVSASVNGFPLDLLEISARVREAAQTHYSLSFDGEHLRVNGRARLSLLRPEQHSGTGRQSLSRSPTELDEEQAFFEYLMRQKNAARFGLRRATRKGWFVEYTYQQSFAGMDGMQVVEMASGVMDERDEGGNRGGSGGDGVLHTSKITLEKANPGPFHGEIDSFSLDNDTVAQNVASLNADSNRNILNSVKEYKEYIKRLAGIRVYRNGFGVRVDRDWLNLGGQQTSGGSWYGLRPDNTLGYVAVSARDNAMLEEKTDREGFVVTPYYDNFYELLRRCVRFAAEAEEFIRRGWNDFKRAREKERAGIDAAATPEDVSARVMATLARATTHASQGREAAVALDRTLDETRRTLRRVATTLPRESTEYRAIQVVERALEKDLAAAHKTLDQTVRYLGEIASSEREVGVLRGQTGALREQIEQMVEAIGLGLTAEALIHEIHNIVDQLARRNDQIIRHLRDHGSRDARLIAYTEYVNTSIAGLRKQLSHFAPSLRYVRERKDEIDLLDFFKQEVGDYHRQRLEQERIDIEVVPITVRGFTIRMNRGKLRQIVDNLFLNSEYWLTEELRLRRIERGQITVELEMPVVRISDNGPGVAPSVQTTLFDPFVTTKGRGKGRGLGLFIVQQLLDSDGCTIALLPDPTGRPRVFEIDFTGVLDAGE